MDWASRISKVNQEDGMVEVKKVLVAVLLFCGLFSFAFAAENAGGEYYFGRDGFFGASCGEAIASKSGDGFKLENDVIGCEWSVANGSFRIVRIEDKVGGKLWDVGAGSAFGILMSDGDKRRSGDFRVVGGAEIVDLKPLNDAPRYSDRLGGKGVCLSLKDSKTGMRVEWSGVLREGSNYVRQTVKIGAVAKGQAIKELAMVDLPLEGAQRRGLVDGSPVFAGQMFVSLEHPMAKVVCEAGRVRCFIERSDKAGAKDSLSASSVIGATVEGQSRRGFQYYVERERIHPYRQFLHYNSWYDIAWPGHKMDEAMCIDVINQLGKNLVEKRGVRIDSIVFDDGWDDFNSLWGFHKGFPEGFLPHKAVAAKYNTRIGTWISPWGGYGNEKKARIEYGRSQGFETNSGGFSLAGKNYNRRYREVCYNFIRDYDCNYFKFDGIGGGVWAAGVPRESTGDVEALLELAGDLHGKDPAMFVNATVGTWPSPYWLWSVDSIWRQGGDLDTSKSSAGTERDKWITYRDGMVYARIVQRAPCYPLNSLMYVGIALAKLGTTTTLNNDLEAFRRDAHNFFGTGTGCQELYITPRLFSDGHWDVLAESAKWAKSNQGVMVDSHWVGGNPESGEVYGYASWSPEKATLMLRNPSGEAQSIGIDAGEVFEIPAGMPSVWKLKSPWAEDSGKGALEVTAGEGFRIELGPLEVACWEGRPVKGSRPYTYTGYEEKRKGYRASREEFVGVWEYTFGGVTYRRQFNADGTARLYINGKLSSAWNGFRWEYDDGRIIVNNGEGMIDGVHKLVDADTLEFVLNNFGQAKRVER